MDLQKSVIPLCIFSDENTRTSYVSLPAKYYDGEKIMLKCDNSLSQMRMTTVYVVNPDIRPIPAGMVLLCVESAYNTSTDISVLYDDYSTTKNCTRFMAWLIPTPYTTPLYVLKTSNGIYLTFDSSDIVSETHILTLYILTDPADTSKIRLEGVRKNISFSDTNFLFGEIDNRIVPDPEGFPLEIYIPKFEKNLDNPLEPRFQPSLLDILKNRYTHRRRKLEFSNNIILIFFCIFVIIFFLYSLRKK